MEWLRSRKERLLGGSSTTRHVPLPGDEDDDETLFVPRSYVGAAGSSFKEVVELPWVAAEDQTLVEAVADSLEWTRVPEKLRRKGFFRDANECSERWTTLLEREWSEAEGQALRKGRANHISDAKVDWKGVALFMCDLQFYRSPHCYKERYKSLMQTSAALLNGQVARQEPHVPPHTRTTGEQTAEIPGMELSDNDGDEAESDVEENEMDIEPKGDTKIPLKKGPRDDAESRFKSLLQTCAARCAARLNGQVARQEPHVPPHTQTTGEQTAEIPGMELSDNDGDEAERDAEENEMDIEPKGDTKIPLKKGPWDDVESSKLINVLTTRYQGGVRWDDIARWLLKDGVHRNRDSCRHQYYSLVRSKRAPSLDALKTMHGRVTKRKPGHGGRKRVVGRTMTEKENERVVHTSPAVAKITKMKTMDREIATETAPARRRSLPRASKTARVQPQRRPRLPRAAKDRSKLATEDAQEAREVVRSQEDRRDDLNDSGVQLEQRNARKVRKELPGSEDEQRNGNDSGVPSAQRSARKVRKELPGPEDEHGNGNDSGVPSAQRSARKVRKELPGPEDEHGKGNDSGVPSEQRNARKVRKELPGPEVEQRNGNDSGVPSEQRNARKVRKELPGPEDEHGKGNDSGVPSEQRNARKVRKELPGPEDEQRNGNDSGVPSAQRSARKVHKELPGPEVEQRNGNDSGVPSEQRNARKVHKELPGPEVEQRNGNDSGVPSEQRNARKVRKELPGPEVEHRNGNDSGVPSEQRNARKVRKELPGPEVEHDGNGLQSEVQDGIQTSMNPEVPAATRRAPSEVEVATRRAPSEIEVIDLVDDEEDAAAVTTAPRRQTGLVDRNAHSVAEPPPFTRMRTPAMSGTMHTRPLSPDQLVSRTAPVPTSRSMRYRLQLFQMTRSGYVVRPATTDLPPRPVAQAMDRRQTMRLQGLSPPVVSNDPDDVARGNAMRDWINDGYNERAQASDVVVYQPRLDQRLIADLRQCPAHRPLRREEDNAIGFHRFRDVLSDRPDVLEWKRAEDACLVSICQSTRAEASWLEIALRMKEQGYHRRYKAVRARFLALRELVGLDTPGPSDGRDTLPAVSHAQVRDPMTAPRRTCALTEERARARGVAADMVPAVTRERAAAVTRERAAAVTRERASAVTRERASAVTRERARVVSAGGGAGVTRLTPGVRSGSPEELPRRADRRVDNGEEVRRLRELVRRRRTRLQGYPIGRPREMVRGRALPMPDPQERMLVEEERPLTTPIPHRNEIVGILQERLARPSGSSAANGSAVVGEPEVSGSSRRQTRWTARKKQRQVQGRRSMEGDLVRRDDVERYGSTREYRVRSQSLGDGGVARARMNGNCEVAKYDEISNEGDSQLSDASSGGGPIGEME